VRYASLNGHLSVVDLLLEDDRVDPTCENDDAVNFAAANGHFGVVRALLDHDSYASDTPAGKRVIGLAAMAKLSQQLEARLDEQSQQLEALNTKCVAMATQNAAMFAILERMEKRHPLPSTASPCTAPICEASAIY